MKKFLILALIFSFCSSQETEDGSQTDQSVELVISSSSQLEYVKKDWCIENLNKTLNFVKLQDDFQNQDLENFFRTKLETNTDEMDVALLGIGLSLFESIEYKQFKNSFETEAFRFDALLKSLVDSPENEVEVLKLMVGVLENLSLIDRASASIGIEIANQCYVWYELNN